MSLRNTSLNFLQTSRDGDSITALGSLFQYLITLSGKKFFPDIQPDPPLAQFEATATHPKLMCKKPHMFLGNERTIIIQSSPEAVFLTSQMT